MAVPINVTEVYIKHNILSKLKDKKGNRKYKYIIHTGSSRSSKTTSIIQWLDTYLSDNPNTRATVWRDTRTSLGSTVWSDYRKFFGHKHQFGKQTNPIHYKNGSIFEPHGADFTNAHGLTQDIAWINEPYKISKDAFDAIDQRADLIIIDWNPRQGHWIDELSKHPRAIVIHSTFEDNPFCPEEQRLKILSYNPDNPDNIENGTANKYNWEVYGLGRKAERPNRIFHFTEIKYSEYLQIEAPVIYGVDWGVVDPMGILEAKYYDGKLFLHEISYKSETTLKNELDITERQQIQKHVEEGFLMWYFKKLGIDKQRPIVCDNNRKLKILALRRSGFERALACRKFAGSIIDGIDVINNLDVYYTHTSLNLKFEQENYSRETDKRTGEVLETPEDTNNHLLDPTRYICQYLIELGVINIV